MVKGRMSLGELFRCSVCILATNFVLLLSFHFFFCLKIFGIQLNSNIGFLCARAIQFLQLS